jgi:8-oxo-dGTP pyrophosphatase MutT (NUDIX family)
VTGVAWNHDDVVARLRANLATRAPRVLSVEGMRSAAVAVLLCDRGGVTTVPMIVRGVDAPVHSGQIALPGGRRELSDETLIATAAREANEEMGVDPARLDVLGVLDDVPTPTGFVITPVVAALDVRDNYAFRPDPREVARWFEAPLQVFSDRAAAEDLGQREWRGMVYRLRAYHHGEHRIWGATARIMEAVIDVLET